MTFSNSRGLYRVMKRCDILVIGTGYFAEIIVNDIASTAVSPVKVVVAGRNIERMKWLCISGNARASLYERAVTFEYDGFDMSTAATIAQGLGRWEPRVVVQSASLQSPWKVDRRDSAWSVLVNDAGFGLTLAFQSMFPMRTAMALKALNSEAAFVNTCYPDVVNQVLVARGLRITSGVGNIAIFASVIAGTLQPHERCSIRLLGHHNHLVQWRRPGVERSGLPVRVWLGDSELADVQARFAHIQLPFRDLNVISGGSAVPVLLALAGKGDCRSHVPGPTGLPGGYPVRVCRGSVTLDLPNGLSEDEAITWNRQFETEDGASVSSDGRVTYSDRARAAVERHDAGIAEGFDVDELEVAYSRLAALRERLGG